MSTQQVRAALIWIRHMLPLSAGGGRGDARTQTFFASKHSNSDSRMQSSAAVVKWNSGTLSHLHIWLNAELHFGTESQPEPEQLIKQLTVNVRKLRETERKNKNTAMKTWKRGNVCPTNIAVIFLFLMTNSPSSPTVRQVLWAICAISTLALVAPTR